ncbi:GTPase RsgA [Candidatus Woesearchaeota archaeon]|nr:MAG: GTPase RsgA [Candidatus Woesearchaeota archaeon]
MPNFWKVVKAVIDEADILLFVLDARFVEETRNEELEERIKAAGKPLIYVINKCDLANKKDLELWKKRLKHCVFVSSKEFLGQTLLRDKIRSLTRGEDAVVGIVGYPNVGKSSIINMLAQKGKAKMSPSSNYTKGKQYIRISSNLKLIDTPGVLSYKEKDEIQLAVIGAKSHEQLKDPETAAMHLIEKYKERIAKHYGVEEGDADDMLEAIALKRNRILSGGVADLDRMSRELIKDWQSGTIK